MIEQASPSLVVPEIERDPMVRAVLAHPVDREFEEGDTYLVRFDEMPIRILRAQRLFNGVHPKVATYSAIWIPTLEQMIEELAQRGFPKVRLDRDGDEWWARTARRTGDPNGLQALSEAGSSPASALYPVFAYVLDGDKAA